MISIKCPACGMECQADGVNAKCKYCKEPIKAPLPVAPLPVAQVKLMIAQPVPDEPEPQIIYVQAYQPPFNGFAVAALIMSMICLLLCWLPVTTNVILFLATLILFLIGLVVSIFKRGAGLMHLVAAFGFGFVMLIILVFQIAALGRATREEFERQDRLKEQMKRE